VHIFDFAFFEMIPPSMFRDEKKLSYLDILIKTVFNSELAES
jgi:hypothetical protein